jgi:hypothetical protein
VSDPSGDIGSRLLRELEEGGCALPWRDDETIAAVRAVARTSRRPA